MATVGFHSVTAIRAATGIRQTINFQGKVVNDDGTNVTDGSYDFEFALYSVSSAGTAIWTETWNSGSTQVAVTDGIFRVELGSITVLPGSVDFNTDNLYLGVNFNSDGEMSPRIRFTAVPYAFNAKTVGGLTVTNTTGTLTIPDGTTIEFSGANNLTFITSGATSVTLPTTGTLATVAGTETLTNKTIGSTGLVFSGATNDIDAASAEVLAIGNGATGTVSICNSASCDTISIGTNTDADTISIGDSNDGLTIASSTFNVASGAVSGVTTLASSGDWTWSATTPTITISGTETLAITNGTDTFSVNTNGSAMVFTDGTNSFTFDADSGPTFAGSARPARQITLSPEYPGATLTGDGGSNTGTMTSDFCEQGASADIPNTNTSVCNTSGDIHNYYSWTTNQGSAQDYDVWVRWRVPDNFAAWSSNPIQVWGKRTDVTNNAVTVYVYDTGGTLENSGGTQVAGTTWTQTAVEASFAGTYTPGSYLTIRVVLTADTGGDSVQVGEINLNYLSNN